MFLIYLAISAVLVAIDQWTKYLVVQNITIGGTKELWPGVVSLTHLQNSGAAWSLLEGKMIFFAIVTTIALVAMIYFLVIYGKNSIWFSLGLSLMIAGALGNFIDRMRLGYVVDMIRLDFFNFPIFNVADMCLTVGVAVVFIFILRIDDDFFKRGKK